VAPGWAGRFQKKISGRFRWKPGSVWEEVAADDLGAATELPTVDWIVARAQDVSRRMVGSNPGASAEDFLADSAREAAWQ